MTINDRVKLVRKTLNLTQKEFGGKIAVAQGHLTNIENGYREVTEKTIKVICFEYHVREEWLRDGTGPMFEEKSNAVLEKLKEEYETSALDLHLIEQFLRLKPENRRVLEDYILSVAEAYARSEGDEDAAAEAAIDREVEDYRRELEAERLGKTSEVSPDTGDYIDGDDVRRRPRELLP